MGDVGRQLSKVSGPFALEEGWGYGTPSATGMGYRTSAPKASSVGFCGLLRPVVQPGGGIAGASGGDPAGAGSGAGVGVSGHHHRHPHREPAAGPGRGGGQRPCHPHHGHAAPCVGHPRLLPAHPLQLYPAHRLGSLRGHHHGPGGQWHQREASGVLQLPPLGPPLRPMVHPAGHRRALDGGAPVAGEVRRVAGLRHQHLPHLVPLRPLRCRQPAARPRHRRAPLLAGSGPGGSHAHLLDAPGGRLQSLRPAQRQRFLGHLSGVSGGQHLVLRAGSALRPGPGHQRSHPSHPGRGRGVDRSGPDPGG